MDETSPLSNRSDKLKSAITYVSEAMRANPGKDRSKVIHEAMMRFDLPPADCEFFLRHFSEQ